MREFVSEGERREVPVALHHTVGAVGEADTDLVGDFEEDVGGLGGEEGLDRRRSGLRSGRLVSFEGDEGDAGRRGR